MNNNKCLSCGSVNFVDLLHLPKAPKNIQGLLTEDRIASDHHISLNLIKCETCSLVQLSNNDNLAGDYYDEYVMAQTHSVHSRTYSRRLAKEFVNEFNLRGKRLLEIGCGDGEFMSYLVEEGVQPKGIEPSTPFVNISRTKGLDVVQGYFGFESSFKEASFDAIASRAVFEHLKNLNEVLQCAWKVLRDGGVGLIEVPSFEKAVKDRRYYDVFSDHVVYYTKHSLIDLLERNGFEVIKIFNEFEDEYIVVYFKKNISYNLNKFVAEISSYKKSFEFNLRAIKASGKRIVLWGAGAKGNALINFCEVGSGDIDYVIDSDPYKVGKYTIGNHFKIFSPDVILASPPDVIIITAMAFCGEILNQIRDKYNYCGEVWAISPTLHKITDRDLQ